MYKLITHGGGHKGEIIVKRIESNILITMQTIGFSQDSTPDDSPVFLFTIEETKSIIKYLKEPKLVSWTHEEGYLTKINNEVNLSMDRDLSQLSFRYLDELGYEDYFYINLDEDDRFELIKKLTLLQKNN